MICVLVVSELRLYREGLCQILRHDDRVSVSSTAESVMQALTAVREQQVDAILWDVAMPESRHAIKEIRFAWPAARVVALGLKEERSRILACAEAGFAGYVCPNASVDELVGTIESAVRDELRCSERIAGALLSRVSELADRLDAEAELEAGCLTQREREVVRLLDDGMSNKEIAKHLVIGLSTVKSHVHNILEKLGVQSRWQAAARARTMTPTQTR